MNAKLSEFTQDIWRRFAGRIDNEIFASGESFTATFSNGFYYLTTNVCDSCSFIKVFVNEESITKITVLGDYTDGWQEIRPNTYDSINKFLSILNDI